MNEETAKMKEAEAETSEEMTAEPEEERAEAETVTSEDKDPVPEEAMAEAEAAPEATVDEAKDEAAETIVSLRAELDSLRAELAEKRAAFERMSAEVGEFSELFPTVSLSSLPDSVWQSVRAGVPLAASYALYEKKTARLIADAERVNAKNSSSSTGPVGREPSSDFFSPDEVRAMSRDEVRKNYAKIMASMKKWN